MASNAPNPNWRSELNETGRKDLITAMYHQLSRVSGEKDNSKIWASAAKFELMLWNQSTSKTDYMSSMAKKIHSLNKKPPASTTNTPALSPPPTASIPPPTNLAPPANTTATAPPPVTADKSISTKIQQLQGALSQIAAKLATVPQKKSAMVASQQRQMAGQTQQLNMQRNQAMTRLQSSALSPDDIVRETNNINQKVAQVLQNLKTQQMNQQRQFLADEQKLKSQQLTYSKQLAAFQQQLSSSTTTSNNNKAEYARRQADIRNKYWGDLMLVLTEFTRLSEAPDKEGEKKNAAGMSLHKIKVNGFLQNVKRAMGVIKLDVSASREPCNIEDLVKVENHIVKVVMPIVGKLRAEQERRINSEAEARKQAIVAAKEKAESVAKSNAAAAAAASASRPSVPALPISTNNITAAQYKAFKLSPSVRARTEEQLNRLMLTQKKMSENSSAGQKTALQQSKTTAQLQKIHQAMANLQQRLAKAKLADAYEAMHGKQSQSSSASKKRASTSSTPTSKPPEQKLKTEASIASRLLALVRATEKNFGVDNTNNVNPLVTVAHDMKAYMVDHI